MRELAKVATGFRLPRIATSRRRNPKGRRISKRELPKVVICIADHESE
jgi:hypothetical protein